MQPTRRNRQLNKARYDVLSIPGCVIKKNPPTHGARHGTSMRQCVYHKAHDMLRKARKHKSGGHKTILDRWHTDDKYSKSLSEIGWTEEQIIQDDEFALQDHSYVATWQERSRNEKSWKISLNAEGIQGPLNQRSDFKVAKETMKRLYDEHAAITRGGDKPVPPGQQVRQRLGQKFEGFEEYNYRLEARAGWRVSFAATPSRGGCRKCATSRRVSRSLARAHEREHRHNLT